MRRTWIVGCAFLLSASGCAQPTVPADTLLPYIESIRAIDNHAHVVASSPGQDTGYDQLRCDALAPALSLPPANLRFGDDLSSAWKALYDVSGSAATDSLLTKLKDRKDAARKAHGSQYHEWVLQQAGIDIVLANRVRMAAQLGAHFRWVGFADALLFPLDNSGGKARNPDRQAFFGATEQLLREYLQAVGVESLPPTLDEYVNRVIQPTLERQKKEGAVAIKFEAAYLRSLDFEPAEKGAADAVYARFVGGGQPKADEYTLLQDFLFASIAAEAGQLGLPVHIHTGSGCGEYFIDSGADPMLLSSALNDPLLRKTTFVLLHGGTPNERHLASLILKPNVYTDISVQGLEHSPAELARILRPWLEMMPEHVMFGTDAGPFGPGADWEETTWMASHRSRRALAIALNGMVKDDVITEARAREIAEGVSGRTPLPSITSGRRSGDATLRVSLVERLASDDRLPRPGQALRRKPRNRRGRRLGAHHWLKRLRAGIAEVAGRSGQRLERATGMIGVGKSLGDHVLEEHRGVIARSADVVGDRRLLGEAPERARTAIERKDSLDRVVAECEIVLADEHHAGHVAPGWRRERGVVDVALVYDEGQHPLGLPHGELVVELAAGRHAPQQERCTRELLMAASRCETPKRVDERLARAFRDVHVRLEKHLVMRLVGEAAPDERHLVLRGELAPERIVHLPAAVAVRAGHKDGNSSEPSSVLGPPQPELGDLIVRPWRGGFIERRRLRACERPEGEPDEQGAEQITSIRHSCASPARRSKTTPNRPGMIHGTAGIPAMRPGRRYHGEVVADTSGYDTPLMTSSRTSVRLAVT